MQLIHAYPQMKKMLAPKFPTLISPLTHPKTLISTDCLLISLILMNPVHFIQVLEQFFSCRVLVSSLHRSFSDRGQGRPHQPITQCFIYIFLLYKESLYEALCNRMDDTCPFEKGFNVNKVCFKDICQFMNYLIITFFQGTKLWTIISWKSLTMARGHVPHRQCTLRYIHLDIMENDLRRKCLWFSWSSAHFQCPLEQGESNTFEQNLYGKAKYQLIYI